LLYRFGKDAAADPQMAAALELARRDPELGRWFEQHCAEQAALRAKFQQISVPADLKARLLAGNRKFKAPEPGKPVEPIENPSPALSGTLSPSDGERDGVRGSTSVPIAPVRQSSLAGFSSPVPGDSKILRPRFAWRQPVLWALAASVVLVCTLAGLWLKPSASDPLAQFQARMVGSALREYRMDLVTNDMRQVRQLLAKGGAPADYIVTPGLEKLQLTGGGLLRWQNHPVAMVCFDRGDNQMLFLFVLDRTALPNPPPATPKFDKVNQLMTASWTQGDKTYVLAGPEEADFARKYL
jgi:hypothetical protein